MQKFTVFTVILTVVVVVAAAELFVNDYLPKLTANVFNADSYTETVETPTSTAPASDATEAIETPDATVPQPILGAEPTTTTAISTDPASTLDYIPLDIEEFSNSYDKATTQAYISNEQVVQSGFTGAYLEPQDFDGFLFKTISIGDLYGLKVSKYEITNGEIAYAKVYVIVPEDVSTSSEIYSILKVRASEGLETEANETNQFGDGSFYMNDSRRASTVFLTTRVGTTIYGFSYPKEYHPQIKNLVDLIKG